MFSHARRLSWSGEILGYEIRIEAIGGADVDLGVPGGSALIALVDAHFAGVEPDRQVTAETVRAELGPEALFDAATVYGNFEMMNRVAEGTGIGIPPQWIERHQTMVDALGLSEVMKSQQY